MVASPARSKKSLSLIELFVVIFVLAVLAFVSLLALNPLDRLVGVRDAQRAADITSLITAVHQSTVDNGDHLPAGLFFQMPETQLGSCHDGGNIFCSDAQPQCLDLSQELNEYLDVLPQDPSLEKTASTSGYSISVSTDGTITVSACGAEKDILTISR